MAEWRLTNQGNRRPAAGANSCRRGVRFDREVRRHGATLKLFATKDSVGARVCLRKPGEKEIPRSEQLISQRFDWPRALPARPRGAWMSQLPIKAFSKLVKRREPKAWLWLHKVNCKDVIAAVRAHEEIAQVANMHQERHKRSILEWRLDTVYASKSCVFGIRVA